MDQSILDYDQSLNDLQRQKEQLELMMRKMGEEWEASGPGINWLKSLQLPTLSNDEATTVTDPTRTMTNEELTTTTPVTQSFLDKDSAAYHLVSPLTPDDGPISTTTDGDLMHILQQPQPSPEYLQSLLNVNETLLAQSLAATPLIDDSGYYVPTATATTIANVLSFSSEVPSDVYTPILTSSSSITLQTPPTTPEDEETLQQ
ncbi:hypothetical protein BC941DRAFT_407595 [Chlamydoabsidia padenii]|nr:hypothetical protein BC941DRAFT_407595 [Chlamydoabsidia padenii]